jgi:hypothetical protein
VRRGLRAYRKLDARIPCHNKGNLCEGMMNCNLGWGAFIANRNNFMGQVPTYRVKRGRGGKKRLTIEISLPNQNQWSWQMTLAAAHTPSQPIGLRTPVCTRHFIRFVQ